jgi:hypothetical protein
MRRLLLAIITAIFVFFCVSCSNGFSCVKCGQRYAAKDNYCSNCGELVNPSITPSMEEYFNFKLIDENAYFYKNDSEYLEQGTYMVISLNKHKPLPEILVIPEEYNGKKVTAVGSCLLDGANIKTLILPASIKLVGQNLCNSNCPMLEEIVCLGDNPFFLVSLAFDPSQLRGGCKIYVPDQSLADYKNCEAGGMSLGGTYKDLIVPHSELDEEIKSYINKNIK